MRTVWPLLGGRPQATHDGAIEGGRLKSFRSPEQLVTIYHASQGGTAIKNIAAEQGIPYVSVSTALHQLNKYLKGKDRNQSKRSLNYRQAAKVIRREKQIEPLESDMEAQSHPQATHPGDNFTYLKSSFQRFQNDVSTFIEVERNSGLTRLRDENKAFQQDNKELRKEVAALQGEIERLKKEEPRTIDWIDRLEETLKKEE